MTFFSIIPDGKAIVHANGVYRQVDIYTRGTGPDAKIYAKYGSGFVRLAQGGATSAPKVRWAEVDCGDGMFHERQGAVFYVPPADQIEATVAAVLEAAE
jgi:hypothetical protein